MYMNYTTSIPRLPHSLVLDCLEYGGESISDVNVNISKTGSSRGDSNNDKKQARGLFLHQTFTKQTKLTLVVRIK